MAVRRPVVLLDNGAFGLLPDGDTVEGATGGGGAAEGFIYNQAVPSGTWTINHGLGTDDIIATFYDENGNQIFPDAMVIVDDNTIQATFNPDQQGSAVVMAVTGDEFTASSSLASSMIGSSESGGGGGGVWDPAIPTGFTVTSGTAYDPSDGNSTNWSSIEMAQLSPTKFLRVHTEQGTSPEWAGYGQIIDLEPSTDSFTWGLKYQLTPFRIGGHSVIGISDTKALYLYHDWNGAGTGLFARILTIAGNSITAGNQVQLWDQGIRTTAAPLNLFVSETEIISVWSDLWFIIDVSGATPSKVVTEQSITGHLDFTIVPVEANKWIAWSSNLGENPGDAVIYTRSGNIFTRHTETQLSDGSELVQSRQPGIIMLDTNVALVGYWETDPNPDSVHFTRAIISGNDITESSLSPDVPNGNDANIRPVHIKSMGKIDTDKFIVVLANLNNNTIDAHVSHITGPNTLTWGTPQEVTGTLADVFAELWQLSPSKYYLMTRDLSTILTVS
jgi:hypothetical protein